MRIRALDRTRFSFKVVGDESESIKFVWAEVEEGEKRSRETSDRTGLRTTAPGKRGKRERVNGKKSPRARVLRYM